MSERAPAGYIYVSDHASVAPWHLAEFMLGVERDPAVCGAKPMPSWDPVTHLWIGPNRWAEVTRTAPALGHCADCERMVKNG